MQKYNSSRDLLEKILKDARPIVPSAVEGIKYDLNSRPTELSSGGYIDYAGDSPD